jgi:hypothetical protein
MVCVFDRRLFENTGFTSEAADDVRWVLVEGFAPGRLGARSLVELVAKH